MNKLKLISFGLMAITMVACANTGDKKKEQPKEEITHYVLVSTPYGDMKIKLYNETPLHRDNFIKLVQGAYYDSLLFHRVIKNFMIQGGDPDSKGAAPGVMLGEGGPKYDLDAEFRPNLFHKKGALAAAREGDQVNPMKKSSGSQFYIVQGQVANDLMLNQIEEKVNMGTKYKVMGEYINDPVNAGDRRKLDSLRQVGNAQEFQVFVQELELKNKPKIEAMGVFKYTPEMREAYKTIGGTPHLDQNYTVFGEVIEGLNVIDSIAGVSTDQNNRPLENIIMKMKLIE